MMGTIGNFSFLQAAIARAWGQSTFYANHWQTHGVAYGWVPPEPAALSQLPVVTKEDLLSAQRANPPWAGNLCIPEREIAQVHLTTGTSGIGQERYAMSRADVDVMGRSWGPQYSAIGLVRGDVACLTIPVSFFCAGLSALEGARVHGLTPVLTGVASKDLMLDILSEYKVSYLYGIESLLLQLANLARQRGLAGRWRGQIKGLQSVGMSPQLLEAAREVFTTKVYEIYGCTQAGAKIANTCSLGVEEGSNHFCDEYLYIETRDPLTGAFVEEGDAELVISTPYREASPVIRFAIRDKVELVPSGQCRCGGVHAGFRPGTLRRMDSMLKIRGVNVWPQQVEQLLLGHPGLQDFRAEIRRDGDGSDVLLIKVQVLNGHDGAKVLETVSAAVREKTLIRPRVVQEPVLPDGVGLYKIRRWVDQRQVETLD